MKPVYSVLTVFIFATVLLSCESDSDTKVGEIVFWYDHDTSLALQSEGAESLTFYIDEQIVGSTASSVYATGKPECGQQGFVSVAMNLGSSNNKSFTYKVIDQNEFERWSGSIEFKDNTCIAFELDW